MHQIDYVKVLGKKFPNVQVSCFGESHEYVNLVWEKGDPLPPEADLIAANNAMIREDVWEFIKMERDRRKAGGVKVGDYWFHSDDASRIQQIGLVMMGANIPANLQWKTMSGVFVTMTQALAAQIFNAVAVNDQNIFAKAEWHKQQMMVSENPQHYDYLLGWPLIYGEDPAV